ncbi:MAG TPA: protein-glutamate O-methyltransferase CheR [Rhodocyclaceae bacterium]|nr:protein-glutamate O-methyltransferase CheR [Rhodocyclaceae bacterium]
MSLDTAPFTDLIKVHCGLLFEGSGEEKLCRALDRRMQALALPAAGYYARLQQDGAEFQELVNLLTINETYFFREPDQITLLVDRLVPRFLAAGGGTAPLRILSAGCSSGEEPYSIAMALLDRYGESVSRLFHLAGADIDSTVLAKAREGCYKDFSFRGVAKEVKERYFTRTPQGDLLKEDVRRLVDFHELNLLAKDFPPALRDFDIIFFRNVSIYFDTPTRKTIQRNLASLLKPRGILVVGTAETLANDLAVLPLVEEDGLFYFVKGRPPLPEKGFAMPGRSAEYRESPPRLAAPSLPPRPEPSAPAPLPVLVPPGEWSLPATRSASAADPATLRQLVHDKRYDEALAALDGALAGGHGTAEARLLKAHVLIERKDFAAADALAEAVLAEDPWSIDAALLRGLAAKWSNRPEDAIRWFKQAVYGRHECWPAHYYLADLYRQAEALEPARRAYRVVIQLLSGNPPDTGIKHMPVQLPASEVRFLCEHHLSRLGGGRTAGGPG